MDALGYVAALFATGSFIPQVVKTWRTRSAEDLSFLMLFLHIAGMGLWLTYGVMLGAAPIGMKLRTRAADAPPGV